jgi:ATP-dependent Clp protease ATP-binding subunit ClpC
MEIRVPVFERHHDGVITWTSVSTVFREPITARASSHAKAEKLFLESARNAVRHIAPAERARLPRPLGVFLQAIRVELSLRGELGRRQLARVFPLVLETRRAHHDHVVNVYSHPLRANERFVQPSTPGLVVADWLRTVLSRAWADLPTEEIEVLAQLGKEKLRQVAFDEQAMTVGQWWNATNERAARPSSEGRIALTEIPKLASDLTRALARAPELATSVPRPALDRAAQALALGASVDPRSARRSLAPQPSARSFVVVGPPGSGRSTVIRRAAQALLAHDGFEVHGNLDLVSHVWEISARRVIAGMSRLGEWEKRALRIVDEARAHRAVLYVTDVSLLGVIGRSRESDRALADVLEGPVSRGELVLWGETTHEGLERLADEAPRLAELLPRLPLEPADTSETHAMLLHRARQIEQHSGGHATPDGRRVYVEIDPLSIPAIALQTRSLFAGVANPGKSMTVLDRLATRAIAQREARSASTSAARDTTSEDLPDAGSLVLEVLEERTGMPVSLLDGSALSDTALAARFEREVVGQPDASRAVVDLVVRLKTRLTDPKRPRAVYLFTGPTGTGKTETAKWIAENVFGGVARLCRFDMAELNGPDAASRLLGTGAPGEASLVSRVREQPFCVVLLDEIEKAHRSVLYLLLQLFDEGRLTDPMGATADFSSTVVVMTSNLGARPRPRAGFATGGESESALLEISRAVRDFFPPELFHRIDRIVPFRPLDDAMARAIVRRELAMLLTRRGLTERRIAVDVTEAVVDLALSRAFDPAGGARSVKRWLETEIAGLLADEIARGGRAEQRRLTLHVRHDETPRLAVHTEALREAQPREVRLLDVPADLGLAALTRLADTLAMPLLDEDGDVAERLREAQARTSRRDARAGFALEAALGDLEAFRERHAALAEDETARERDRYEDELDRTHTVQRGRTWSRRETRRQLHLGPRDRDRGPERTPRALRAHVAEALAFRRALPHLDAPEAHVVDVLVTRLGVRTSDRMEALAHALAPPHATLVTAAARHGASVRELDADALAQRLPADEILLRFAGLGVRSALEADHGTHLLATDEGPPELVSVHVLDTLAAEIPRGFEERGRAREEFRAALERGERLPNPDPLLPLVRTVRLVRAGRERFEATLEDHVLGEVFVGRVRDLGAALDLARERWSLRLPDELDLAPLTDEVST